MAVIYAVWCLQTNNLLAEFDTREEAEKCVDGDETLAIIEEEEAGPEYPDHNPELPVVAFDFDGVVASNTWPSPALGEPDQDAFAAILHYYALGCEVVIFTARPDEHLREIRSWLGDYSMDDVVYEVTNRKPRACLYFDDRAVRWPL